MDSKLYCCSMASKIRILLIFNYLLVSSNSLALLLCTNLLQESSSISLGLNLMLPCLILVSLTITCMALHLSRKGQAGSLPGPVRRLGQGDWWSTFSLS